MATTDMGGRKEGAAVPHSLELGPRLGLVKCGLGRGLLPYHAASSSIQPFGHNRCGPKTGWGCAFFWGAASQSNTKSPGPMPTTIPSGMVVHPAIWPQRTLAEKWGLCLFRGGKLGPHHTQCRLGRGYTSVSSGVLIHPAVWPQWTWADNWGVPLPFWGEQLVSI